MSHQAAVSLPFNGKSQVNVGPIITVAKRAARKKKQQQQQTIKDRKSCIKTGQALVLVLLLISKNTLYIILYYFYLIVRCCSIHSYYFCFLCHWLIIYIFNAFRKGHQKILKRLKVFNSYLQLEYRSLLKRCVIMCNLTVPTHKFSLFICAHFFQYYLRLNLFQSWQ